MHMASVLTSLFKKKCSTRTKRLSKYTYLSWRLDENLEISTNYLTNGINHL
jgi:hypothetical protein